MPRTRAPLRARAALALAAALLLAGGCVRWQPAPATLAPTDTADLRVRTTDGRSIKLADAVVWPDSVVGRRWEEPRGARIAIPRAEICSVQVAHADPLRTMGLLAAIVVGALIVVGSVLSHAYST